MKMVKQMEWLFSGLIFGNNHFMKKRERAIMLERIFRKSEMTATPLTILSVHGNVAFNTILTDSVPESANITRLSKGLRNYRSQPRFDLIFYSIAEVMDNGSTVLLENISYSRMLLKSGAFLFLVRESSKLQGTEESWLQQAGFMKIKTQKQGGEPVYIGGQRPLQNF